MNLPLSINNNNNKIIIIIIIAASETTTRALRERKLLPTPKFQPNLNFQISLDPDVCQIVRKCCGCIILSASVISPSMVQVGR